MVSGKGLQGDRGKRSMTLQVTVGTEADTED